MSSLDKFYDKDDVDIRMYAELAPESIIPFKEKLLELLDKKQQQMIAQQGNVTLTPEEQATINKLPPEQQAMAMQQLRGQQPNNQQQAPK